MIVTRFAPSPTGQLHTGHAFSALFAARAARGAGGRFLLRMEDIDKTRCKRAFEIGILDDLDWLGLQWETPVRRQSEHFEDYQAALERLDGMALTYPCFCTRKEIAAEIAASISAPHGPDGPVYPGTCRELDFETLAERFENGDAFALRLDMAKALAMTEPLTLEEKGERIAATPELFGDIILARKEMPASYHLAVTVDDAIQGVTLVTRGEDLLPAASVHRVLQALLGFAEPRYHHHKLLTDEDGRRLAKRDGSPSLADVRATGISAADFIAGLGFDP